MSDLAKDVAKQLDRRHRRRRLFVLGGWVALVALAAIYLRCGRGWGLGGKGGDGTGTAAGSNVERRCAIRVAATGITVDGKPMPIPDAVGTCVATRGADIVVTGDAREGDWKALRDALDAAGVPVFVHGAAHR